MKIYEVTGQQPQQTTKMKVVQAAPNKVTLQDPNNPQTQTTFDPSKNPNAIQQGPEGVMVNPTADPNAPPTMPQLQPGSEVNVAGGLDAPSQPGSPLTPNPKPQDQAAAEDMANMKKLAGIEEQPTTASQIPTSLTVAGMLNDPEVDPAMKPQLQKLIVAKPDGTVDLAQTMRKASGEFYRAVPELIDVFQSLAQQAAAFVKSPEFSELGPQDQNSIIDLAKTIPSSLQQMQAQITKGAQAHDAGFNKMDAATGQYGDGQVEEIGDEPQTNITIGGLSRRTDKAGNTTDRYQAGPMDITTTKNAQGQPVHSGGTYQVNKTASINVDVPYKGGQKGITTTTGTAADPSDLDHLMGADAVAQRKGVDPRAFARFQQGLPREDYVPTGYNDKNREKAMMRKAMQQITQDKKFVGESKDIVDLARRISNIEPKSNNKQRQDVIDLKKLAGL